MRKNNLTKAVETTVAPNPKEVDMGLLKIKSVGDETSINIMYIGMGCELMGMPTTIDNSIVAVAGFNVPTSHGISGELSLNSWVDAAKAFYTDITDWSWLTPITREEFYDLEP